MGDIENKKIGVYFEMPDTEPNVESFLNMAVELGDFICDEEKYQKIMLLNPKQVSCFLSSIAKAGLFLPSSGDFHTWIFAGFMIRTLDGKIR